MATQTKPLGFTPSNGGKPDGTEQGDSGAAYFWASQGTVRRLRELDYLWELTGSNAYRVYDRMRFGDPKVAGLRRALDLPLLRASVAFEPASVTDASGKKVIDPQAQAYADFASDAFFNRMAPSQPWRQFLANTQLCLDYGFAPFEIVWRGDDDGKWRVDRLAYRPPSTVEGIYVENGRIAYMRQYAVGGGLNTIPGEKLVWFANDQEGENFRGRPLLRPMHKPWFAKEKLEVLALLLADRMGGIPVLIEPETELTDAMRKTVDDALGAVRVSEHGFLRLPFGSTFSLQSGQANLADVLEAIRYHSLEMTSVCMLQVLDLGVTQAGNRALGQTLNDMFTNSVQARAQLFEDTFNGREGVVHQLLAYNFPDFDEALMPQLRFGDIAPPDFAAMAKMMATLAAPVGAGGIGMPFGAEMWDWIRQQLNWPETDTQQVVLPGQGPSPAPEKPAPGAQPNAPTPSSSGAGAGSGAQAASLALSSGPYWRRPHGVERYVELAQIKQLDDDAKQAIREATQATRDALVRELGKRARAAAAKGDVAAFVRSQPPMVDALAAEIRPILARYYAAGKEQVAQELERQKEGRPVVEETIANRQGQAVNAATKPPKGYVPPAKLDPAVEAIIADQADIAARTIATGTLAAAAQQATRITTVPIDDATFDEFVRRASDGEALRVAGMVTDLMAAGRAAEAQDHADEIADAVYSAILDDNVCSACEARDGEITTDLDEAAGWAPNPDCEGGDRCRCIVVYEYKQGGA